jgi:hypothetical protein
LIAATVGVFVFLLRMPITGHMAGIAIEARRIAANVAKLPELSGWAVNVSRYRTLSVVLELFQRHCR